MTNTYNYAKRELDILASTVPDAVITPFSKQILSLCEAFGNSGQSGASAPFTATAISKAVKHLMLHEPICPVSGTESEWSKITAEPLWQNNRCSALFKNKDGQCDYLNAIVWKGQEDYDTYTGSVYIDDISFKLISSSQFVKFPFTPKTFYIDVLRIPITKEDAERRKVNYTEDRFNKCYYTVLKDPKQLDDVFKYYIKK